MLERDHWDVEAACYSCCSVGPDPTVGGQHYHGHLTQRNQGTCTNEGELCRTSALRSNHYVPVRISHHPDKVSFASNWAPYIWMQSNSKWANSSPSNSRETRVHPKHSHVLIQYCCTYVHVHVKMNQWGKKQCNCKCLERGERCTVGSEWMHVQYLHPIKQYNISIYRKQFLVICKEFKVLFTLPRGIPSNKPSAPCNSTYKGKIVPVDSETLWICRNGRWLPYRWDGLYEQFLRN